MNRRFAALCALAFAALASATTASAADAPGAIVAPLRQWVYVLKPVPRLHDDDAWTKDDERLVGEHFRRLQRLVAERVVILAGRTTEPGDRTFGLVIFEATDESAARAIMEGDPAVAGGIMTATLHPYAVALQRADAPPR